MNMKLKDMLDGVEVAGVVGSDRTEVTDLCTDSRKAVPGCLFACLKGSRADGSAFAEDAARRGATAILSETRLGLHLPVTEILAADVRRTLAQIAARFFGRPSEHLKVTGVTGTNGKTTTVHLVRTIAEASGEKVGVMGTLGHWVDGAHTRDVYTTPEAQDVQRYMRRMVDGGAGHCLMEVSSHAIALRRVDDVAFDVVAFTNLTRDHLDFHRDFGEYKATKMKLFGIGDEGHRFGGKRKAAINVGDSAGREVRSLSTLPGLTYAVGRDADVRGDVLSLTWQGTRIKISRGGSERTIETPLRGRTNAENLLAAYTIGLLLGLDEDAMARGIAGAREVPGRMEYVEGGERKAIVDYAHTPDALERLLKGVREIRPGKIVCVFGCGGDRDRGKRPQMAAIAARLADLVIVTSDNPRTEDPLKIIEEIVAGLPAGAAHEVVPDRAEAIHRAVALSGPDDVIVIAGKGHEDYQIIGAERIHLDDRETVRKAFGAVSNAKT
jgi:UDP-N-acetylmuramoyl-L-alanyl-D-glutamate--2,6-diaminopimelate ligase